MFVKALQYFTVQNVFFGFSYQVPTPIPGVFTHVIRVKIKVSRTRT